ncbi:hypothetical protein GCM10029976_015050 [Kribbella albertanoniae]
MLLVATSCGAPDEGRAAREPSVGPIEPLTSTLNLLLPLDQYMLSLSDYRRLAEARRILVRRCMQRLGIDYKAQARPGTGLQTRNERRYGITDQGEARQFGYRKPQPPTAETPPDSAQDPKMFALLFGKSATRYTSRPVPAGGCVGEAHRGLATGRSAGVEDVAQPLAMKSWSMSAADSRVRQVFATWSACMKRAGFDYPTPLEVLQDRELRAESSPAQRATAVADTACKREHNVVSVWAAVEAAYQSALIEENRSALDLQRQANATRLRLAAAVLIKNR